MLISTFPVHVFNFIFLTFLIKYTLISTLSRDGDVARWIGRRTGTPLRPFWIPWCGKGLFSSPRVSFQCRLAYGVRTPPCPVACIYICAHSKDPVVHVRVRWAMKTLKHPASTVGWTARLCRSWLFPGESNPNFPLEKFQMGQYSCNTTQ